MRSGADEELLVILNLPARGLLEIRLPLARSYSKTLKSYCSARSWDSATAVSLSGLFTGVIHFGWQKHQTTWRAPNFARPGWGFAPSCKPRNHSTPEIIFLSGALFMRAIPRNSAPRCSLLVPVSTWRPQRINEDGSLSRRCLMDFRNWETVMVRASRSHQKVD